MKLKKKSMKFAILLAGFLAGAALPLRAQEGGLGFPLLFDSRERLARPDMSEVPRLRFLTSLDFPPFNFADTTGRPTGFHIDLAREICDELDIVARCQIEAMPFPELKAALDSKQGDAIIAGMAITQALREDYLFSRPFMLLPARLLANGKAGLKPPAADALKGRPLGLVEKSAHEAMAKAYFPEARAVTFPDRAAMLAALRDGKVDAVFGDGVQLAFWAASPEADKCCRLFDGPFYSTAYLGEGLSIMMRPEDDVLAQAMDHALLALSRKGRLKELYLRYFPYGLY